MNIDEIKQLVQLMVDNELSELDITDGDKQITLKRASSGPVIATVPAAAAPSLAAPHPAAVPAAPASAPAEAAPPAEKPLEIRSPMVGTFYASSSPDSDAYVRSGSSISDDSVVCIVEAMKVMNEIKAECAGTVAEVCVKNAQPVEFGQVLFRVKPA